MRNFLNATTAHRLEIDRRRQRNLSFVRADIRGRFFTPYVLLARSQCQNKTPSSLFIVSFADQASGNLSRIFVTSGEQADVWTTIGQRHAEGLTFRDDNVRAASARRTQQSE